MNTLKIRVRKCPNCDEDMDIRTYRPEMCGSPRPHYELVWYCPCYEYEKAPEAVKEPLSVWPEIAEKLRERDREAVSEPSKEVQRV